MSHVKERLNHNPTNPLLLKEMGKEFLKNGHFKDAVNNYKFATLYNPRLETSIMLDYEEIIQDGQYELWANLALVEYLLNINRFEEAEMELEELLEQYPHEVEIYNILGKVHLHQNSISKSIKLLEKAIKTGIKDITLIEMLASAYIEQNKISKAIDLYEELLKISPKNKRFLRILGELYKNSRRYDLAAQKFALMLDNDPEVLAEVVSILEELAYFAPDSYLVHSLLGNLYSKNLKPHKAAEHYLRALELSSDQIEDIIFKLRDMIVCYPNQEETLLALGYALAKHGDYSEACSMYQKVIRLNPRNVDKVIEGYKMIIDLCPQQVFAHQLLSEALLLTNQIEEAAKIQINLLEINPDDSDNIIKMCKEWLVQYPNVAIINLTLAHCHLAKRELRRATTHAENLLTNEELALDAYCLLGKINFEDRQFARSSDFFKKALTIDPYNTNIFAAHEKAGKAELEEQIKLMKEKMEQDPWKLSLHFDLAKLYWTQDDLNNAIKVLQTAIKDVPKAPFAYNLLGLCFREMGRFDLAEAQFNKGLELATEETSDLKKAILLNKATVLHALGKIDSAIKILEQLFQLDINFQNLNNYIQYLSSSNPTFIRNKTVAIIRDSHDGKGLIPFWGRDFRHTKNSINSEALSISFGQDHNNSGFENCQKRRYEVAKEELLLATQLDPSLVSSMNNLAAIYLQENNISDAKVKLHQALEQDPNCAIFHNNLAIAAFLENDLGSAFLHLKKAVEIDNTFYPAFFNLGDYYYSIGDPKEAIICWEKAKDDELLKDFCIRRLSYKKNEII